MNIASWLYQTAKSWPNRPAILSGAHQFATYGELNDRSAALALFLRNHYGIERGDRVAIFAQNCPEYLEILHAVWWLGAVVVPINYKLHKREAAWIVDDAAAKVVFVGAETMLNKTDCKAAFLIIGDTDYSRSLDCTNLEQPAPCASDDVAWLFYTSGTTGKPKGVMLTHDNLVYMSLCYSLDVDQVFPTDTVVYAAPMSHGAGLYNLIFIRAGARHLVPETRGFDPKEIAALASRYGNLVFFAAPTMVKRLISHAHSTGFDGAGIRTIIYGGGPMYAADIDEALRVFGNRFVQIYGQGESPMTITALSRDLVADVTHANFRTRRASVGFAQACVQIEIRGPDGRAKPSGETGEIAVFGPTVMKGYWNNPEATSATLVDEWLMTGDLGHLDEDGFLYLTDRSKDVIISGGTNIYPREVEEVLLMHPDVFEVAVIGAPEPEWGEEVVAFVVLQPGSNCDRGILEEWCRAQMASFKKPKKYHFIAELPKNSYGKVLKTELRKLMQAFA